MSFQILPVVVFFSAVASVLYYVGAMQSIIKSIAIILQAALKTTPIESFATAAHIFVGQVGMVLYSFVEHFHHKKHAYIILTPLNPTLI